MDTRSLRLVVFDFNLFLPSIFGCIWMTVFSGTAIQLDMAANETPLYYVYIEQGEANVMYSLFEYLPLAAVMSILYLLISFLSYVTAVDSNTSVMSGISASGISPKSPEPSFFYPTSLGRHYWHYCLGNDYFYRY